MTRKAESQQPNKQKAKINQIAFSFALAVTFIMGLQRHSKTIKYHSNNQIFSCILTNNYLHSLKISNL